MKKLIFCLVSIFLLTLCQTGPASANANSFTIKDFQADYYLDKDSSGIATLKTVEKITATFPDYDQNHGIERALPLVYKDASVDLKIESIKNENGEDLKYTTSKLNNNLVIRIGDADKYVRGDNVYVVTYDQSNVIKTVKDKQGEVQEFYWDVNGNDWTQSFSSVTARLHLSDNLKKTLNGNMACYRGSAGSDSECKISNSNDIIAANILDLKPGEGMTIAIGFNKNTFIERGLTLFELLRRYFFEIVIVIESISLVSFIIFYIKKGKGSKGRGTIVAEYLPPENVNVATSSVIFGGEPAWIPATYIDLAVRHNIKIINKNEDSSYDLEYINSNQLDDIEASVIKSLFGDNPIVGARYSIKKSSTDLKLAKDSSVIISRVRELANGSDYYSEVFSTRLKMILILAIPSILSIVIGFAFGDSNLSLSQWILWIVMFILIVGGFLILSTKPLSEKGRELYDYLQGLKLYIKTAEADRIKILQSPQGASRSNVDVNNSEQMIVLYERVLPYAILFGQEKEWTKVIGLYYEQSNKNPDWYSSNTMFSSVMFCSAMGDFKTSSVSNSYVAPSSSSSGGSSGGGFSGGGGGGGGGGGW